MTETAFQPAPLPKLALWMASRRIKPPAAAPILGVQANQVRKYIRPFGDPARVIPPLEVMARIVAMTDGEVRPADFYPPELSTPATRWPAQHYARTAFVTDELGRVRTMAAADE